MLAPPSLGDYVIKKTVVAHALRDYQQWAVDETWRYFETNRGNPVIAMPTGTGKSHVIAGLLQKMLYSYCQTRAMVLTHVKELIVQDYEKFIDCWPNAPAGIYSAGLNKKEFHQQITFGGIGSVVKKAHLFGHIDIVFVDECDLVSPSEKTSYNKFFAELRKHNPLLKIIGLTATPWRQGQGHITEDGLFTDVCVDMTGVEAFNWFIDEGYLIPLVPKPTKLELDISGVHMRGGEFIAAELQVAVDKNEITEKALREAMEAGHNRHSWLIFASGVSHAKNIADMLTIMGIDCKAVYSGMEADGLNRDEIIRDFKAGKLRAVVNNNVLTTGFDYTGIDFILMLRPTGSSRLWVQMLGRGTRPMYFPGFDLNTKDGRLMSIAASQKHNTLVMDFAANIRKLGPINDPVLPKAKGKGPPGVAPIKECPECNTWNHATVRYCGGKPVTDPAFNIARGCGYEFKFVTKLKVEASTEALIKGVVDLPIVKSFKVDHITYTAHHKNGKAMLKATYYCGLANFTDYVCVEHDEGNYALRKAREWWRTRSPEPMPRTCDAALDMSPYLRVPTHLSVWVNQKYPTITAYCYDGTDFGTRLPTDNVGVTPPTVATTNARDADVAYAIPSSGVARQGATSFDDMDDDIPF